MRHATAVRPLLPAHVGIRVTSVTGVQTSALPIFGRLLVRFRRADLTPHACHQFEAQLHEQLQIGERRVGKECRYRWAPYDQQDKPAQIGLQGVCYRGRYKTTNRSVATRFVTVTQW